MIKRFFTSEINTTPAQRKLYFEILKENTNMTCDICGGFFSGDFHRGGFWLHGDFVAGISTWGILSRGILSCNRENALLDIPLGWGLEF